MSWYREYSMLSHFINFTFFLKWENQPRLGKIWFGLRSQARGLKIELRTSWLLFVSQTDLSSSSVETSVCFLCRGICLWRVLARAIWHLSVPVEKQLCRSGHHLCIWAMVRNYYFYLPCMFSLSRNHIFQRHPMAWKNEIQIPGHDLYDPIPGPFLQLHSYLLRETFPSSWSIYCAYYSEITRMYLLLIYICLFL